MELVYAKHDKKMPDLMRDLACFFARYKLLPKREDSYSKLIDALTKANEFNTSIFSK